MKSAISPRSRTISATFRITSDRLVQLHKESEAKTITLNTLVNQIIKDRLDWHERPDHPVIC